MSKMPFYDIPLYMLNNLRSFIRAEVEEKGLAWFILYDLAAYNRVLAPFFLEIFIPDKNLEECLNNADFKYEDLGLIVHYKRG